MDHRQAGNSVFHHPKGDHESVHRNPFRHEANENAIHAFSHQANANGEPCRRVNANGARHRRVNGNEIGGIDVADDAPMNGDGRSDERGDPRSSNDGASDPGRNGQL